MSKNTLVYFIAAIAALGGLLFGYDTGIIATALPYISKEWILDDSSKEWVVSIVLLGGMLGALLSSRFSDVLGRKKVNFITGTLFAIASILSYLAQDVSYLVVSRFLIGLAVGIASYAVPLYIAEIAPMAKRGGLVSLFQFAITIGIMLSYICGYLFKDADNNWRLMFLVGIIPALILMGGLFFLPETPRWLMSKGREAEALAVLNSVEDDENVQRAFDEIKASLQKEKNTQGSWAMLFSPKYRIPLMIGFGIFVIQQFSGINAVIYYAPEIFTAAGFESNASFLATIGVGTVNVLATLFALRYLDRWGRRPLLMAGMVGVIGALLVLSASFYFSDALGDVAKWLSIGSVYLYIVFFAVSLGPLGWLLLSEVFPQKIRSYGMSLGSFSHWFNDFLVSFTFLSLKNSLGTSGTFMFYAGIVVFGLLVARRIVPETKGLSLEQIEELW